MDLQLIRNTARVSAMFDEVSGLSMEETRLLALKIAYYNMLPLKPDGVFTLETLVLEILKQKVPLVKVFRVTAKFMYKEYHANKIV